MNIQEKNWLQNVWLREGDKNILRRGGHIIVNRFGGIVDQSHPFWWGVINFPSDLGGGGEKMSPIYFSKCGGALRNTHILAVYGHTLFSWKYEGGERKFSKYLWFGVVWLSALQNWEGIGVVCEKWRGGLHFAVKGHQFEYTPSRSCVTKNWRRKKPDM